MSKLPLRDEGRAGATKQTLGVVLRDVLKLFHPAIPYLTEELWSELVAVDLLAGSSWPTPPAIDAPPDMDTFQELITGIRRFRAEHGLGPRAELEMGLLDPRGIVEDWWVEQLASLAAATPASIEAAPDGGHTRIVAGNVQGFIRLEGIIDADAEHARISKAVAALSADLERAERKLANDGFRAKAPAEIIAKEEGKVSEFRARLDKLQAQLAELE
jgi:valyl-tRNA synthetase